MATFTITVSSSVPKVQKPYILSETYISDECKEEFDLFVPCPAGQNRYVEIIYLNAGSNSTQTISSDSTFTLTLDFFVNTGDPNQNTQFSTGTINVYLTNGGDILFSRQINRQHTGTNC